MLFLDFCCLFVYDKISPSPGWPLTHYVAKDDLILLILLLLPFKCWGDRLALALHSVFVFEAVI